MGITEFLIEKIVTFIDTTGYASVALLMMLESMVAPVPSEAVMPFAGFLIATGRFTFTGVIVASTAGSIIGSWLSYLMGYYGGRPVVTKFGRYLLLNHHDLDITERFFTKYGSITIFVARFIPVIRHLISIPAGMGKMKWFPFTVYTAIGAGLWNFFLAWLGYYLRNHWELIHEYSKPIDILMILLLILALVYFIRSHIRQNVRSGELQR
jgi:membrane protein DedA with SNARE-associated domain